MANYDFENYEAFARDCGSWAKLGIVIKAHKIKAYCQSCKKWTWIIQRKSYSGFTCQCVCGIIYAIKNTDNIPGGYHTYEKHFDSIEELAKHFNLQYYE
jgi:hypothetical protein